MKIVKFDDFKKNPHATFSETCQFLGINDDFAPSLDIVNQRKSIRSRKLERIVTRPPRALQALQRFQFAQSLRQKIREANRANPRPQLTPQMRSWILQYYAEDIFELQEATNLDFSEWLPKT